MSWQGHSYDENDDAVSLTSGTTWTDLCSVTRYVDSGHSLLIDAAWVADAAVAAGDFRITVNDDEVKTAPAPTGGNCGSRKHKVSVASTGYYTVKIQCRRANVVLATLDVAAGGATLLVLHTSS